MNSQQMDFCVHLSEKIINSFTLNAVSYLHNIFK